MEAGGGQDANIVGWDGPEDAENPTNWTARRVVAIVTIVSTITLLRFVERTLARVCKLTGAALFASSIFAPGILQVLQDFESTSSELGSFIVSVFVIGYGFGPLIIAPLSEIYGRTPLCNICSALFVVLQRGVRSWRPACPPWSFSACSPV